MTIAPYATELAELRGIVSGPVLTAEDSGFAEEITGFNLANEHRPDVVVGVANPSDVAATVRFAADTGLPVRMQATGHGSYAPFAGGVLISTKRLDAVSIDPATRVATVGAGVRWLAVQAAAAPLGLTAITGSSPDVGAIGLALGGGLGPLARSHGFTSDYVRGFTIVTADGSMLEVDAGQHPDLFWALRGGKGGLGVVTEMRIELVPLATIYAGALYFDEPHIETVLRGWVDWTASAPDDVTTSMAMINFPPLEQVPEPLRGRRTIALRFAYPGSTTEGEQLAAPLRALAPALIDAIGVLPTAEMGVIHSDPDQPIPAWDRGMLLSSIDQEFADELLAEVGPGSNAPIIAVEVRQLGGATRKDVTGGSAAGGRASDFSLTLIGVPDPDLFDEVLPQLGDRVMAAVAPWLSPETNINFAGRLRSEEHFASAWPTASFERLAQIRERYDPHKLFVYGPITP